MTDTPPKRVRTAYAHYVQIHYRRVARLLDPDVPQAIIKALAEEWRHLSRENKIHYYNLEAFDRGRYRVEKDEWMQLHGGEPPKSRRRKKSPKAPKRKRNPFTFYAKEVQDQVRLEKPHLNSQEEVREIVLRWRALPAEDKEKYREMAQNDKTRYANELKLYFMQKVAQPQQQAEPVQPQPQEVEPQQSAVAPIQPQQQDAPQQQNPRQNANP